MLFITAQQLPSFMTWDRDDASSPHDRIRRRRRVRGRSCQWLRLPRLKPRQVPIAQWLLQVTTFASGTLLNNLVYAYSVPLTIQIVFRSAGKQKKKKTRVARFFSRAYLSVMRCSRVWCTELMWAWACRTGRVHVHRPRIHGQAIHAPTNSTYLCFPHFSLPPNGTGPADAC